MQVAMNMVCASCVVENQAYAMLGHFTLLITNMPLMGSWHSFNCVKATANKRVPVEVLDSSGRSINDNASECSHQ